MNKEQKAAIIDGLTQRLSTSPSFYVAEFTGIPVKPMTELRRKLRRAGSEFVVVKNTLALRAFEAVSVSGLESMLKGPTGLVFAGGDPVTVAKVLAEFQKEFEQLTVRAGIVEGRRVTSADVTRLATLPPRDQLLGQLAGAFQAPLQGFVGALGGLFYQVVGALEALRAQRANG